MKRKVYTYIYSNTCMPNIRMYIYKVTYKHVDIHIYVYRYAYIYIHAYMYVHTRLYIQQSLTGFLQDPTGIVQNSVGQCSMLPSTEYITQ